MVSEEYNPSCAICAFRQLTDDPQVFECRRFPPQVFSLSNVVGVQTAFPRVRPEAWCGEWRPLP